MKQTNKLDIMEEHRKLLQDKGIDINKEVPDLLE
jgi:hypothetical protein